MVALVAALSSPLPAQAMQLCEGASRTGVYLPTVLPEEDGWTRFDDVPEGSEPADVFLDDGSLIIDASGATALFQRREPVSGLASAYHLEMEASQIARAYYGGWLKLGGYIGALFQDRLVLLFGMPAGDEVQLGIPVDPGDGSPHLLTVHLATIDRGAFHTISITAERDGLVEVNVDGAAVGGVEWNQLPFTDHDVAQDLGQILEHEQNQAGVFFGAIGSRTAWKRIAYEICLPHNLDVQVTSTAPEDPGSIVLRGGTGQTLEGFEEIGGTLSQVTAVHRSFDDDGEGVVTLSDEEQEVVFLAATDDGTPRGLAAFDVPPGYLSQLRLHVSDMSITLAGNDYPVRVGGGAQSGIKVLFPGGLLVPEREQVAVAVDLDLTQSLSHNQGQGFVMDPVVTDGTGVPQQPDEPAPPVGDDWPIYVPPWVADLLEGVGAGQGPYFPALPPGREAPMLTAVEPLIGVPGDLVTLHGSGLDFAPGALEVRLGESEPAQVLAVENSRIVVRVPVDATLGRVKVRTRPVSRSRRHHRLSPSYPTWASFPR
ncbi:MAG: DUF4382 domain-containing protein [Myxococcota bacterium]